MPNFRKWSAAGSIALMMGLACSGCGGGGVEGETTAAVKGTVTFDGQPIEKGQIYFTPFGDTKGTQTGGEIINGEYSVPAGKGPTIGKHKVRVHASRDTGKEEAAPMPAEEGTMVPIMQPYIPAKYNRLTELDADIKEGDNKIDYTLTPD